MNNKALINSLKTILSISKNDLPNVLITDTFSDRVIDVIFHAGATIYLINPTRVNEILIREKHIKLFMSKKKREAVYAEVGMTIRSVLQCVKTETTGGVIQYYYNENNPVPMSLQMSIQLFYANIGVTRSIGKEIDIPFLLRSHKQLIEVGCKKKKTTQCQKYIL